MNWLRMHYRDILGELADSRIVDHILSQLFHQPVTFNKLSPDLSQHIRQSNYALS